MAEVVGIVAAAIAFAQATVVALDALNRVKDAPQNIRELHYELADLADVLRQIDDTFPYQKGDPVEAVLRSCSDTLRQLHDLVAPYLQDAEGNHFKQYMKGLRIRPKESEIENAVKRLQSHKLTLTLALITGVRRGSGNTLSAATTTYQRQKAIRRHAQDMLREPDDAGVRSRDMSMLTRIIDQRITAVTQQLYQHPTSKVEDLLDLDKAQVDELWRLDFESVRRLKGAVDERKREKFLESLCTPDYQKDRVQIKDPSSNTCNWIWDHREYLSYRASTESCILHVLGKAGSGKSVLAKHVWRRLSRELADSPGTDSCALLYYCCDNRTRSGETSSSMMRALIHQFLWERPSLFGTAIARNELMQSHSFGETTTWTFESLWSIFKAILINSQLSMIHCIIDALDESEKESMEMFLSLLLDLLDQGANGVAVKLFLTSRMEGYIVDCLEGHAASIRVDSVMHHDVETYVSGRLGKLKRRLRLNADGEKSIRQVLVERAEGMFLWAELAITDLEKAHGFTAKTLTTRVRSLPSGLDALYERMLTKIDGLCANNEDTIRLVRKIFTWVALTTRPLTLAELRVALAIELDTECLDSVEPLQNISYDLLDLCGSFIEIVQTDKTATTQRTSFTGEAEAEDSENEDLNATVRLVHQSAKEYLIRSSSALDDRLSKFRINCQAGHCEIARTCLTYLLCRDFENGPVQDAIGGDGEAGSSHTNATLALLEQKLETHEFLKYAAVHWPAHAHECSNSGEGGGVHAHASKFLSDFPQQFQSWYQVSFFLRQSKIRHNPRFTGLHAAAGFLGLYEVTRLLLDRDAPIDARDIFGNTPMLCAALVGNLEMVELLLNRGADINAKRTGNGTPLLAAAQEGHVGVVKLLLDRGAEIEAKDTNNWTALHAAARNGHVEVAKLLLDRGAEIEAKDTDNWTALHTAARNGHVEVVKMLLDRGAEIEATASDGQRALHLATKSGHLEVAKMLLEGSNNDSEGGEYENALRAAADIGKKTEAEACK